MLTSGTGEPPQRLVGWEKVSLEPGHAQQVRISIPAQRFATWSESAHGWRIDGGSCKLMAASSSRDPNALSQLVALSVSPRG
ncbi:fibronectin type III-like domain-contianing protein [Burkholderia cenocepacia]|nr:fibronectin type III-like domain-contianing protein [Burkholderia cenocepacia]